MSGITVQAIVRFAFGLLLLSSVPFLAAGTLNWPMAWAYTLVNLAAIVGSRLVVLRLHPDLILERAHYLQGEGVKGWDRFLSPVMAMAGPLAMAVVAGVGRRLDWPPAVPIAVQLAALAVYAAGCLIASWAMVANRFFSGAVRIQQDRGQTVVSTGPYRFVRHPAYAAAILTNLSTPLALGSLWALIPALITIGLGIVRTALEDRTLRQELDGYEQYTRRVRHRLLPGVW